LLIAIGHATDDVMYARRCTPMLCTFLLGSSVRTKTPDEAVGGFV